MPGPDVRQPQEPPAPRRRRPAAAAAPQREGTGEGSQTALARMLEQEKFRGGAKPPRDDFDADELLGGPKA